MAFGLLLAALCRAAAFAGPLDGQWIDLTHAYHEELGTRLAAPRRLFPGRRAPDDVPLEQLAGAAVVVDVSAACAENPDYEARVEDLQRWEKRYGEIPRQSIVLIRTGFGRLWPDAKRYLRHHPGLHPSAARWLIARRAVKAVGIDAAAVDHGPAAGAESQRTLLQADVVIFENAADLDRLPPTGSRVIALPARVKSGGVAPLRLVAFFPR